MGTFICTRCGKCCISLGRHIRIERSLSSVQHYVRNAISGEVTLVTIHPERRALFSEKPDEGWCPFLRREQDGRFTCTIYENRPAICRNFRCLNMVISSQDGTELGQIVGKATITTKDPVLKELWNNLKKQMPMSDPRWFEYMQKELKMHGYTLEPVT
ncbi:MAG TPA: YkgJ family cysteine cluster protein [Methanolinea sp.]|nr:YkgJ family cysteine cluster protein [Methanolinea sp.]